MKTRNGIKYFKVIVYYWSGKNIDLFNELDGQQQKIT